MSLEDFEGDIQRLVSAVRQAAVRITVLLSSEPIRRNPRAADRSVGGILSALLDFLTRWVADVAPRAYTDGAREASEGVDLRRAEHRETLQSMAEEMADNNRKLVNEMRADANRQLREMARQRAMESLEGRPASGSVEGEPKFTDRSGRRWAPETYVEMASMTFVAKTRNAGHLNAAAEIGSPGVLIRDGGNPVQDGRTDEPCVRADGERWSLAYFSAHLLEHPRCRRSASALSPSFSGELDRE